MTDESPCSICGVVYGVGDWPWCPHSSVHRKQSVIDPFVVFIREDGNVRIPGDTSAPTPDGYNRVEMTTIQEMQKFERDYGQRLNAEASEHREIIREAFEREMSENRRELNSRLRQMDPTQRRIADALIAASERRSRSMNVDKMGRGDNYFEVLHYDRSNRDAQRDARTGWKRGRD